tara:strand:+ start:387 stop:902 length:516 start_codon:yes stop_codon:yes gene_type:complete
MNKDVQTLGEERQNAHPKGTPRYYDNPNVEDTIGIAGELKFAERYGLKIDDSIRPDGDGHVDFMVGVTIKDKDYTISIDVKTAQKAYNLLIKDFEIAVCSDILVLAMYKEGEVTLLGWETRPVMAKQPTKVFSSLGINNYYLSKSKLRTMEALDEIMAGAVQIETKRFDNE